MTVLTDATKLSSPTTQETDFQGEIAALHAVVSELPGGKPTEELTISSGIVTPTTGMVIIDTEGATASDNLDRIVPTNLGEKLIIVQAANTARTVVLRHNQAGSGKILLKDGQNLSLDDEYKCFIARYNSSSDSWIEVLRSQEVVDLSSYVQTSRTITAGTGLTGGGNLSEDRSLAVNVGTGANQIVQLDGSGALPAVDGSALLNLATGATAAQVADIEWAKNNVSLLALNSAINNGWTIFNLVDGFADEFNDQSGVDISYTENSASPINMTSNTAPSPYVASATSDLSSNWRPWGAFSRGPDDLTSGVETAWYSGTSNNTSWAAFLRIDLGSAKPANAWSFRREDNVAHPISFTIEGSNDGSAWDVLDTVSGIAEVGTNEKVSGTFDVGMVSYRYYQINITQWSQTNANALRNMWFGTSETGISTNAAYDADVDTYAPSGGDITLVSQPATAEAEPTTGRAVILADLGGAAAIPAVTTDVPTVTTATQLVNLADSVYGSELANKIPNGVTVSMLTIDQQGYGSTATVTPLIIRSTDGGSTWTYEAFGPAVDLTGQTGVIDLPLDTNYEVPATGDHLFGIHMANSSVPGGMGGTTGWYIPTGATAPSTIGATATGWGSPANWKPTIGYKTFVAEVPAVSPAALNTDLMVDMSRDDGTTWTAATLVNAGDYDNADVDILTTGATDISAQPSGTNVRIRLRSANSAEPVIHAWTMQWS